VIAAFYFQPASAGFFYARTFFVRGPGWPQRGFVITDRRG
jgi:hypothetical protein